VVIGARGINIIGDGWYMSLQKMKYLKKNQIIRSYTPSNLYTALVNTYSTKECKGSLPERWFYLDKEIAIKAYIEGVKRWV